MKLWMMAPNEGTPPLHSFLDNLEEKQRQKLFSLFALLLQVPEAAMREPYVKHFGIERYQRLYELRAKSKNMIRITFTLTENGDILFLVPFGGTVAPIFKAEIILQALVAAFRGGSGVVLQLPLLRIPGRD